MAMYLVHAGYGKTEVGGDVEYIDAPTLASLYGLEAEEYDVAGADFKGTKDSHLYINLRPREDGLYRNIKTELGDNGTDYHYDTMVNPEKYRRENKDYGVERYSSR